MAEAERFHGLRQSPPTRNRPPGGFPRRKGPRLRPAHNPARETHRDGTEEGGSGAPLTPHDASGNPRFPLVENLPSRKRGDVGAHLHGQNVDSFTYSVTQVGFAKTDMLPFLQDFNQWIVCTYPSATPPETV